MAGACAGGAERATRGSSSRHHRQVPSPNYQLPGPAPGRASSGSSGQAAPPSHWVTRRASFWNHQLAAASGKLHWQTRKCPIPVPPIPDLAGKRGGNFRVPIGRERESGNLPFPDSAGKRESGPRLAANREIGDTLRCEYSRHIFGGAAGLERRLGLGGLPLDWAARHVGLG